MKVLFISADTRSLIHFRRDLMKDIKAEGHEVFAISPPGDERGDPLILEDDGINVSLVDFNRTGLNPFKDISTFFNIFNIIKKIKPDLVFSFMIKPVIYGSIAAFFGGVREIYSLVPGVGHVFLNKKLKGKVLRFIVSRMYQCAFFVNKKVFFQNNDDKDLFISHWIIKEKKTFKVNGSGVDMSFFERKGRILDEAIFLLAGRIIREKGIQEYIEAARIVKKKKGKEIRFLLAGGFDKNPTSYDKESLDKLNFDKSVEYLGDQRDMRDLYEKASIYVLPSFREGTPRSTLEAMSMKMPVITTDVPGCRETVNEGVNGHLIPSKSAEELALKMEAFIEDSSLIASMGQRSHEIVKKKFEVRKVNKTYIQEMGL